jgi:GNAT superfamily N-acetyltransferase
VIAGIANWTTGFPQPPLRGARRPERDESWQRAKRWSGRPDLEWTQGVMTERFTALGGYIPGYYYDDVSAFPTARALLRVFSLIIQLGRDGTRIKPSAYPTVTLGFRYFDSAYRSTDGRLKREGPDDPFRGRHYVTAYDGRDESTIRFANSWGDEWGDNGYGYIDEDYFNAYVETAFVRWSCVTGPSPEMSRWLDRAEQEDLPYLMDLVACWQAPNQCATTAVEMSRRTHTITRWQTVSLDSSELVDVFEMRNGIEIVGRLHVKHDESSSTITELFVLPRLRRHGYGGLLSQTAAEAAQENGSTTLHAWLRRGDHREPTVAGANALAVSGGFAWNEKLEIRPPLVAIASKNL